MQHFEPMALLATIDAWPSHGEVLRTLIVILDLAAILSVVAGRGSLQRKLGWTIAVVLLPVLGMVLYFLCGRSSTDA